VEGQVILEALEKARRRVYSPVERLLVMRLEREVALHPTPRSVGIIMDGNRRWAARYHVSPWIGHRFGKEKVRELLQWCKPFKIRGLVLYAFSAENFSRNADEVAEIMKLMKLGFEELATDPLVTREGIRVRVIGRTHLLPPDVQQAIHAIEEASSSNDTYHLTFAIAYGGRAELTDACRAIASEVRSGELDPSSITDETIRAHLYAPDIPDPDLIIRTSGEQRISNFLPWQSVYSELFFTPTLWPSFSYIDFLKALRSYQTRDRRLGR
jgi:tritrans,polycis-undecaprenyl-diphosphate synthase [geranylgeranyl-diphosphate specific]